MDLSKIINGGHYTIVDVRTVGEFMGAHVIGSINVPLQEIPDRITELKAMQAPIIFCCASGGRSFQAKNYLHSHGIECYDGGPWTQVNFHLSQANKSIA